MLQFIMIYESTWDSLKISIIQHTIFQRQHDTSLMQISFRQVLVSLRCVRLDDWCTMIQMDWNQQGNQREL